jgi:glycosyltransferase involved in cell wall biosynthesis
MKTDILMICGQSRAVINFRLPLIKYFISRALSVTVLISDSSHEQELASLGIQVVVFPYKNRSTSISSSLKFQHYLSELINGINPRIILTYQAKSNIFGCLAKQEAKSSIPVISMVEGLGDPFTKTSILWKCIRAVETLLYRKAFKNADKVLFLNNDDLSVFVNSKLVSKNKAEVVHGIGIDVNYFVSSSVPKDGNVLFCARLLKTKGTMEFCKAAQDLKPLFPKVDFVVVGPYGDVKQSDIKPFVNSGAIGYLGEIKDMRPIYAKSRVFVLPSYREGFPMTIMEAMSCGRPIITTDVAGCRDAVISGVDGLVVKPHDVKSLESAMSKLLCDYDLCNKMGLNARKSAEDKFDFVKSQKRYIEIIDSYLKR